jgi:ABC-2 type transport system ATP-binding protein
MTGNMATIINVQNLTKKFGDFVAVNEISFQVDKGEILGFLGANGAGKTTVMRMLCGLLIPTSGKAVVAGFNVFSQTEKIKLNIGYMSQKFSLFEDLTVLENLQFYAGIYRLTKHEINKRTNQLIDRLGMENFKNELVRNLPLGHRQKLAFSAAIVHNPKIVFLDEPTGGVDPVTRRAFWEMIYETAHSGITVFVTTHYLDEAEYCDRISMMVDGRIEGIGSPGELKKEFECKTMYEVFLKLARKK